MPWVVETETPLDINLNYLGRRFDGLGALSGGGMHALYHCLGCIPPSVAIADFSF